MRAIILAAGFGTRNDPLTKDHPIALLPIGNKTVLDYLVAPLEKFPMIREVMIMTNARFYLDFYKWRKKSSYKKAINIEDNKILLPEKECGAIRDLQLAIDARKKEDEDYLILCSDNVFDFPLSHFLLPVLSHPQCGFTGFYDLKDKMEASKYGVIQVDHEHRVVDFEEKPVNPRSTTVSVGVYYFPSSFRHHLDEYLNQGYPADKMGNFIAYLSKRVNLYGIEFEGTWFDIGSIQSYEQVRKNLNASVES